MHLIDVICAAVGRATMYCIVSFYVYSNIIRCRLQCKFLNEFALLRVFATLNRLFTVFFVWSCCLRYCVIYNSLLLLLSFLVRMGVIFCTNAPALTSNIKYTQRVGFNQQSCVGSCFTQSFFSFCLLLLLKVWHAISIPITSRYVCERREI